MNAKHSHFTIRRALGAAAGLCFALAAAAQPRPFDRALRNYLWLAGSNAAGLRAGSGTDISFVELYGGMEEGGYRHEWESPSPWRAGAEAGTVKHLERFSMKGGFSFEQMSGPDMCGSMSLRPGYFPLDVIEFTPGRKTRQTYSFDGSISIDISEGWRIGAGMDFTSANYSKRKDLRHTNYLLDLTFSPGLTYTVPSGDLTIGANYIYRKTGESITAEQVGTGESSYYAFLDKWLLYGKYEVWTGSGVHLDETGVSGFPQREHFHGVGLEMGAGRGMHFYAGIEYLYGSGSAGEKQTIWYRFPSHNVNTRVASVFGLGSSVVYLRGAFDWRLQTNSETVLDKVVSGGVTLTEEYGANRIPRRESFHSRLEAEVVRHGFEYVISLDAASANATASQMYPFLAENDRISYRASFAPAWYRTKWDFGGCLGFGIGTVVNDSLSLGDDLSGVVTAPFRLQEYYDRETEYFRGPDAALLAFVRRHFARGLYAEAGGSYSRAFGTSLPDGSYRCSGILTLGWSF